MRPTDYFKKHAHQSGRYRQLSEQLLHEIAATKLPFTAKNYYAFCDKYLEDDVHEALFLDSNEKYFREITTDYDTLKHLFYFRQLYNGTPVFCDIGCGIGNVVHYAEKMGFQPFGYEINEELRPLHKKLQLDIEYVDILQSDLCRLKTVDIIYIYRPINDIKLMNKLFNLIHDHTTEDILILYNYPHAKSVKGFQAILLGPHDDMIALLKA